MADDPYTVLGVARDADADAIRRAYRALAKRHHPDLNPGDAEAEARFKSVSAAHALLSDPAQRARFDRGEIDAAGEPAPPPRSWRHYAEAQGAPGYAAAGRGARPGAAGGFGGIDPEDLGDILGGMFRDRATGPRRGADRRYELAVALPDALRGGTRRLSLPDGATLDVRFPPGIDDGETLRLRGKGAPGRDGAPDGDALILVRVLPSERLRREGADLFLALPVTLREAVLGARVTVPTPAGPVAMAIPPGAETGQRLRLRGRGVPARPATGGGPGREAGDLYVTLAIHLGPPDPALADFLRDRPETGGDPRAALLAELDPGEAA